MKYVGDTIVYPQHTDGSGYRIPIPAYHRAAIGVFPGTKLFVLSIPGTTDLIVTPIEPNKWGDLWKLDVALKDTPGAARSIMETLVNHKVNILIQEGLSDYAYRGGLAHRLLLVLDLSNYSSDVDGDTAHRKAPGKHSLTPNHLITTIVSRSVDFLLPTPSEDRWDLRCERMEFFYTNKEHTQKGTQARLLDRSITVPDQIVHGDIYRTDIVDRRTVACHIISDTEEKYIKIRFLDLRGTYALIRIEHAERTGAILSFMNVLKKKEANISSSYSRVASMSEVAVWYALFELPAGVSQADISDLLQEFSRLEDVKTFTLLGQYGFAFDVLAHANALRVDRYRPLRQSQRTKHAEVSEHGKYREIERRLNIAPFYAAQDWNPARENVFMAVPLGEQYEPFYEGYVRPAVEGCGLRTITDKSRQSISGSGFVDSIRFLVATSNFLIADLTGLMPNVLYAIAIAQAVGKRTLLVCEDRFRSDVEFLFGGNDPPRIYYSPYKAQIFAEQLTAKTRSMWEDDLDQ